MQEKISTTSCRRTSVSRQQGFSLLELLVALTILAIALVPVAYFYSKSLQQIEAQSIRTRALSLAMDRMTEIRQTPVRQLRKNNEPSTTQKYVLTAEGAMDQETENWSGHDFEANGESQGMFYYPVPLTYNPYSPDTWGYDNSLNVEHFLPNDGLHNPGLGSPAFGSHVNINGAAYYPQYEYEPVGFYKFRVQQRDASLDPNQIGLVSQADRRLIGAASPSLAPLGGDYYRSGSEDDADKYSTFGRRTVIVRCVAASSLSDTDGDDWGPNDDFDGGATALNPYPIQRGPDDKFTKVAQFGPGFEVTVQVFWLPRRAPEGPIAWRDLNKVELKSFIAEDGTFTWLDRGGASFSRNDQLIVSSY